MPSQAVMKRRLFAAAACAVVAQAEGRTLSLAALSDVVLGAGYLDFVEGAVCVLVVGAAVYRALDAGVGLIDCHSGTSFCVPWPDTKEVLPQPCGFILPAAVWRFPRCCPGWAVRREPEG